MTRKILSLALMSLLSLSSCQAPNRDKPAEQASPKPTSSASLSNHKPSPSFQLTAPDGSGLNFNPSENPDQEVFLLLFWSHSWDKNVETLLSRSSELHERYGTRGLTIIAITYDEEPAQIRKFLATHKLPFDVAVGNKSVYESFDINAIPSSILVDRDGRMVERWSGYYSIEELSQKISPHLPGRIGNSER